MKTGWVLLMGAALSWPLLAQERAMPGVGAPVAPIVFPLTAPSYSSGMIGLGVGQAMRVVATNVGVAPPVASAVAIPACGVDVKIFDSNGKQVGSDNRTDSLASQASFAAEQAGPTSDRAEYRAQIQIVLPNATSNTGGLLSRLMVCNIVWTIQVYDTQTKKTDFVVTGNPIAMGYIPVPLCQTGTVCPATTTGAPVAAPQAAAEGTAPPQ